MTTEKQLMTGNEAMARGAWEAGVRFAAAYPGTPSTEILENLAGRPGLHAEWAPNEKVAFEAAAGASLGGVRAFASMKHVGLNVAADPMLTFSYIGVGGGMVFVSADEPGMHSSQNEQDNRNYAKMAKVPMLEPSDSQEAKDFIKLAFEISEEYDTVVMVRATTRLCHSKGLVAVADRVETPIKPYAKDAAKRVTVPARAIVRRGVVEERMKKLAEFSEATPLNKVMGDSACGVIASGMAYCFAREVFGEEAAYLKLGFTNPLPAKKIKDFCQGKAQIYIVEENDPYIEEFVKGLGVECHGRDTFPPFGELTPDVLRRSLTGRGLSTIKYDSQEVIPRPPSLCAGCPHRGFFYQLGRRRDVVVSGDIGCYTLAFAPPYNAMDFNLCMGASISSGYGLQAALDMAGDTRRVVAVLGDSTFFHSGMTSLAEVFYNGGRTVNVILDNRITGMTGHQENPGSGRHADLSPAPAIDLERLVRALGAQDVRTVNPNDLKAVGEALDWALALPGPSVIICRWPCALKKFSDQDKAEFGGGLFKAKYAVDEAKCVGCKKCLGAGCPAMSFDAPKKKATIDPLQCAGCAVCAQICPKAAIAEVRK